MSHDSTSSTFASCIKFINSFSLCELKTDATKSNKVLKTYKFCNMIASSTVETNRITKLVWFLHRVCLHLWGSLFNFEAIFSWTITKAIDYSLSWNFVTEFRWRKLQKLSLNHARMSDSTLNQNHIHLCSFWKWTWIFNNFISIFINNFQVIPKTSIIQENDILSLQNKK